MEFSTPTQTVLYTIEQTIKEYRKFSQKNISQIIEDITVDQALVLIILHKKPELSQHEIAALIFKDNASITRILELMVKKAYIKRTVNERDRRKHQLTLTAKGLEAFLKLKPTVEHNRRTALSGVSEEETLQLYHILQKIITNCHNS